MSSAYQRIQSFERSLDKELGAKRLFSYDPARGIIDSAGAISLAFSDQRESAGSLAMADHLSRGFDVALPELICRSGGAAVDEAFGPTFISDLTFMSHYFMLREYLYYTYNAPDSLTWTFKGDTVDIAFKDRSIPRQFAQYYNSRA